MRSAAVFGWIGATGLAATAIVLGENPFRTEGPILIGLMCGGLAAFAAAFYTMFETFARRAVIVDFIYFELLTFWSLTVWIWALVMPDGKGLGPFVAGGSMAVAVLAWPLCRFRIARTFAIFGAAGGVLLVAGYFVVASRIGQGD
jgi:hypothetical protein